MITPSPGWEPGRDEPLPGWTKSYVERHALLDAQGLLHLRTDPASIFAMSPATVRAMLTAAVAMIRSGDLLVADIAEADGKMLLRARSWLERNKPSPGSPARRVPEPSAHTDQWLLVAVVAALHARAVRRARGEEQ